MADYRKLAIDLIAADGNVDEAEIKVLKKALYSDGKIAHEEVKFLIELRSAVGKKNKEATPAFDKFYLKAILDSFMDNKIISEEEAGIVSKSVIGDKKLEVGEIKKFLDKIKKECTTIHESFTKAADSFAKKHG